METTKADLKREILRVRAEYREALERREAARRYHDQLMAQLRELEVM